jgi:tripartite ATP-independent transporter DctM subunit
MDALLLFALLFGLVFLRMPVPFAMLSAATGFILLQQMSPEPGIFAVGLKIVPQRIAPSLESFPLLAIPLFVLAGNLLNVSGIADRIFDFCKALVGHLRGGLAHVNILASVAFAGMSGVAQADAAGLGTVEIRAMTKAGYTPAFSAAVTAASAIIGPVIPPSVIMVIYAVLSGASISKLFLAGIIPGLVLALVLMLLITFLAATGRIEVPVAPRPPLRAILRSFWRAMPGLLAPVMLIGGLIFGVATPTELGGIVTVYALVLGFATGELSVAELRQAFRSTVLTVGSLVFIIACAAPISWLISVLNIPQTFSEGLLSITENKFVLLLIINLVLLVAGLVMETTAILLIGVPAMLPLMAYLGMDPTQFGVMMIFNLLIGAITPPFGVILFIMMDIAKISYGAMIRALLPFYIPIIITLLIITLVPPVTLFLPELVSGTR